MDEARPSRTAEGAAIQRALHQTLDAEPKILDDPLSARLVDPSSPFYRTFVQGLEGMPPALRVQRQGHIRCERRMAQST